MGPNIELYLLWIFGAWSLDVGFKNDKRYFLKTLYINSTRSNILVVDILYKWWVAK